MPLNSQLIGLVEECVSALARSGEPLMPELRKRFPGVTFARCAAEDMDEAPYRSGAGYRLYLIDSREGCIKLAARPEMADSFVVVAT